MCGFTGLLSECGVRRDNLLALVESTNALAHRGPDDEGYLLLHADGRSRVLRGPDTIPELAALPRIEETVPQNERLALGFRRLSIIELGAAGRMPMHDRSTGNWLVFNGEIYNYRELRQELIARGHIFHSYSDSEVLLKAYAEWGQECVNRLNGMWAFALWDARWNVLFCSRDRFGEKPFYFRQVQNSSDFWFASEIRPLLIATGAANGVNEPLVWDFLVYGLADHTEDTFFTGIRQLLPGTCLVMRAGQAPHVWQYYTLKPAELPENANESVLAEELRQKLFESVRLRLRSDVPMASFFSGGLDSASIVALADEIISDHDAGFLDRLRTFTSRYPDGHPLDESFFVRAALPRMSVIDPEFVMASERSVADNLDDLIDTQEQPFHNLSILAAYNLLKLICRQDVKVVLTGEGGDELLAGYQRIYLPLFMRELLRRQSWLVWAGELHRWGAVTGLRASGKGFFHDLPISIRLALHRQFHPLSRFIRADFWTEHQDREAQWVELWRKGPLQHRLNADVTRFNLPQLLRHLDRNAMRFGIEPRVPFLDPTLVEFCAALPDRMKLRNGYSKYALRKAMSGRLPDDLVWNQAKLGFGMAEQSWFKQCAPRIEDNRALAAFVDVPALVSALRRPEEPHQSYWLPVSLGLWLERFIGNSLRWTKPFSSPTQEVLIHAREKGSPLCES